MYYDKVSPISRSGFAAVFRVEHVLKYATCFVTLSNQPSSLILSRGDIVFLSRGINSSTRRARPLEDVYGHCATFNTGTN